jgi:hypothetical protein
LVLLSSYTTSSLGRIDLDGCMTEVPDIALGGDPVLTSSFDETLVISRDNQLVYEVDPKTLLFKRTFVPYADVDLDKPFVTSCLPEGQELAGTNPYDADLDAHGRLWVARWDRPSVAIIDANGDFFGAVDLSSYADADGLPEVSMVRIVGDRAYVALERIDRCAAFKPVSPGVIVVIDVATRDVVTDIQLGGANPFGRMVSASWDSSGGTIAVALPGDIVALDDGDAAAIVDLPSGKVTGFGRESELEGSVTEVVLAGPDEAYMIVSTATDPLTNWTRVVRIDPQTGQVGPTLLDSRSAAEPGGGYCHVGLAVVGQHLLVGSRLPCEQAVVVLERQTGREVGVIRPSYLPPVALQALP